MILVSTLDGKQSNVMTISWTVVVDFTPVFAITTGLGTNSFVTLRRTKIDLLNLD